MEFTASGNAAVKMVAPARGTIVGNGHRLTIGSPSGNSKVRIAVRENAKFIGYTQNDSAFIYGTDTIIELAGGETEWPQPRFYGTSDPNGDCRMRVSGGTHYLGRTKANAGLNYSPSIGYKTAGTRAVFEQSGGLVEMGAASQIFVADGGASVSTTGRVELTGGVLRGKLAGGSSAACRGGSGRAELYASGGTIRVISAAAAYITGFDEAILGERGLTFESSINLPQSDSSSCADVKQAFSNETGVVGRFVKTGTGAVRIFNTSAHGETTVANGTAKFMSGVGQFGRSLVVTNGATLIVSGSITAERMSLGDGQTSGTLALPAGAVVTLTGDDAFVALNGRLDYAPAATKGTYTIFRLTGTVDRAAFLGLALVQSSAELHYAFQFAEDGGDTLVQIVTYGDSDVAPANWQGATGVFEASGNWAEGSAPGVTNQAVFTAGASVKDVTIAQQTTVDNVVFQGGDYVIRGSEPLGSFGFSVSDGSASVLAPVSSVGNLAIDVAEGAELTLGGALFGNFMASKTGKGLLNVASSSSSASSDWTISNGTAEFLHPEAAGVGAGNLTVGHATLRFAGAGETSSKITVAAGAGLAAVIDAATNVTVNGGFTTTSGGTLKTGVGTLDIKFPAGTYYLAKDDLGVGRNALPGTSSPDMQPVPADGEVVSNDGIAGFTVREGAVRLTGAGAAETTVKQQHWTLVGGKYTNDVADAELVIANLTYDNAGTDWRRTMVGLRTRGSCIRPALRVTDRAVFKTQGLLIGGDDGESRPWYPTFEITNAMSTIESSLYVGQAGRLHPNCHPTVRILADSDVYLNGASMSLGIQVGANADVLVDGGVLRTTSANAGLLVANTGSGSIRVQNGGVLKVTGIMSPDDKTNASTTNFTVLVDGGTLELLSTGETRLVDPQKRQVEMGEKGGTVCVDGSLRYAFRMPIKGSGALTKMGTGELVVGVGSNYNGSASGLVTAQWTGLTTVAGGTMTFEETLAVSGRAFFVADGATIDLGGYSGRLASVSGGGTIRNATVNGLKIYAARPDETPVVPELAVALSGNVLVDFGVPRDESISRPSGPVPVARLGDGASFNAAAWKARNCGNGNSATFSCEDGVVYATFCNSSGMTLIFH